MLHNGERRKDSFGRPPVEWSHGETVVLTLAYGQLLFKISKGIEGMAGIEFFIILPVTALDFSVVPGCVGLDPLVLDLQLCQRLLKERGLWFLVVVHAVGEL